MSTRSEYVVMRRVGDGWKVDAGFSRAQAIAAAKALRAEGTLAYVYPAERFAAVSFATPA